MAITDINTGKITGCEPGTATYRHEEGHIVFNNSDHGIKIVFYRESFLIMTIISMIPNLYFDFYYLKLVPTSSALMFLFLYMYEELWCWIYAYKKSK